MLNRHKSSSFFARRLFIAVIVVSNLSVMAVAGGWGIGLNSFNVFAPPTHTISGKIRQYNFPAANTDLAGVTVTLSGDQAGSATTDGNGNYSFTVATGGSYLVTPTLAGYTFDPVSRSYSAVTADVTTADFTGYTAGSPRVISVVSQNVVAGTQAVVPVTLESQGNENSIGFSVSYDPAVLSNPVAAIGADCGGCAPYLIVNSSISGKVGIIVARPSGLAFAAGTRQVVTITFDTILTPPAFSTPVTFGDTPVLREVINTNADPLFATYADGAVTFVPPTHTISGKIRQYNFPAANTDLSGVTVTLSGDQAGSATTDGNGNYSFTVATGGSYLVTPTLAGYTFDPVSRSYSAVTADVTTADFTGYTAGSPRVISVVSQNVVAGTQAVVPVTLESQGNENSIGFSVSYDPAVLSNPVAAIGADCGGCAPYLIVNSSISGKVGIIVARPSGLAFAAGTRQVVTITFDTILTPPAFSTPVTFGDTPVLREVINTNADPLFATYADGAVTFVPPTHTISGKIRQYNFPAANTDLAGVTVTLSGDQAGSATTDGNGNYSFTVATGGSYLVTPTLAGYTFDPVSRSYSAVTADVTTADFTGYTAGSPRVISVVSQNVVAGTQAVVPVTLESQGNENSIGFSVSYNSAVISNPVVAVGSDCATCSLSVNGLTPGVLGILIAKPTNESFIAGTRQVVTITFDTILTPPAFSTPVTFGDTPALREVVNTNADPLFSSYLNGAVTFATGYESDVAPRFNGDNLVSATDYVQTGLFAAGLNIPDPLFNEFQRTDSAPKLSRGDGFLTVADYTQAGRYAAGLDLWEPAGGPAFPSLFSIEEIIKKQQEQELSLLPRVLSAVDVATSAGQQVTVSIQIEANGDENGFGFTISYDETKLSSPLVTTGVDMPFSSPIVNTLTAGKVGVITAWPTGGAVPAGTRQIVKIRFNVSPTASAGTTPITFTGFPPVVNQVSDAAAGVLPTTFTDGTVTITGTTAAVASVSGSVVSSSGRPVSNVQIVLTDGAGVVRRAISTPFGFYSFEDVPTGSVYILSAASKQFTFQPRVVNVLDDLVGVDLIAEP